MDSFWNPIIDYVDGKTGRSIRFPALVKLVLQNAPQDGFIANRQVFKQVMDVVGGPVKAYALNFVQI